MGCARQNRWLRKERKNIVHIRPGKVSSQNLCDGQLHAIRKYSAILTAHPIPTCLIEQLVRRGEILLQILDLALQIKQVGRSLGRVHQTTPELRVNNRR
jgi:hypothetical protein